MITALQIIFATASARHWVAPFFCGAPLEMTGADLMRDVARFNAFAQACGAISGDKPMITEEGGN